MSYTTGFYEGRLGIGLSSTMGMGDGNPRYPLDINGDIRLTGSIINGDGQVLSLTPPEFDPVGLDANNSLIYNFEKQGSHTGGQNILIGKHAGTDLTTGWNNVCLGLEAGSNLTTANHHIAIGYYALRDCTDRNSAIMIGQQAGRYFSGGDYCIGIGVLAMKNPAGNHNIAIGYSALEGPSGTQSHWANVAIGYETIKAATSAFANVVIGYQASNKITSGNYNVSLGYHAGQNITTGTNNVCIGQQAGMAALTTNSDAVYIGTFAGQHCSSQNIGIGYQAMQQQAGSNNIGIGYNSLKGGSSNTGRNGNVAIGYHALPSTSSASYNCAVGWVAGQGVSTGQYNVFMGYQTGISSDTCNRCIFIGDRAGYSNTTADYNIGIGSLAIYGSCTATHNIGIGYEALFEGPNGNGTDGTTSGRYNVCMGYKCGKWISTGAKNVYMGYMAGQGTTHSTAHHNVCLGPEAGYYIQSGSRNVCLGDNAGRDISTGTDNVFIGTSAGKGKIDKGAVVAIGKEALMSNAGGQQCVAIGYQALKGVDGNNHYDNTAIGYQTMRVLTTANSNCAYGYASLLRITTGTYNCCSGKNSGEHIYTANYNCLFGAYAGRYFTSGGSNVCIGAYTATANTAHVNAMSNCICIGTYAGPKTTESSITCKLMIGAPGAQNSDTYRGTDGAFIYGDFSSTTLSSRYLRINGHLGIGASPGTNDGLRVTSGNALFDNNVGIGTTSPAHPLHIASQPTYWIGTPSSLGGWWSWPDGGDDGGAFLNNQHYFWKATNFGTWTYLSMRAVGGIWTTSLVVSSDERIKENIVDVPDNLALQMVRDIPCKYYEYRDKRERGLKKTIGFIAQEVKEVLPMAVNIQKEIIPNELRKLKNISWDNNKLTTDLQDVSGVKYRFYVSNDPSGNDEIKKEVIGNSDNTFTFDVSYNNVFCYGKEVDDFHTLDKQKIFTLHHSAIQELDKKVIALENENTELKAELAAIKQHLGI